MSFYVSFLLLTCGLVLASAHPEPIPHPESDVAAEAVDPVEAAGDFAGEEARAKRQAYRRSMTSGEFDEMLDEHYWWERQCEKHGFGTPSNQRWRL